MFTRSATQPIESMQPSRRKSFAPEPAPQAGIEIHQRGLLMVARRPEAMAVLEDFAAGPMGGGCRLLGAAGLRAEAGAAHTALDGSGITVALDEHGRPRVGVDR